MAGANIYDLEERTISIIEEGKQLTITIRSVAANFIEANEKLGDKNFINRFQ